jgi:beta-lactamase regulating signal transducer with metallopeptidase domain
MNWAHIHLMVNHIPVLGTFLLVLLLAVGLIRRSPGVIRTALWATVVLAVLTVPVYLTGEPAEEQVEGISGVEKTAIEHHEEQAKVGLIAVLATGALAALALWGARRSPHRTGVLSALVLLGLIVSSGLFARTAWTGGPIRHAELRARPPAVEAPEMGERD